MAEISRFFQIVIAIYFKGKEHNPPHFHAYYKGRDLSINIKTLEIMKGIFPKREKYLVLQWAKLHKAELLQIWETQKFKKIKPLEEE
jgi:hypothetical protein